MIRIRQMNSIHLTRWILGMALAVTVASSGFAQTIKIGVISPLTGPGAPWGMAVAEAAKIAAAEANAKGGLDVGGKKQMVEVIAYDDQYKVAESVAAYNRLTKQDGVKYVIVMSSAPTMALKQSIEDDKVLALSGSMLAKSIDADTKYQFRVWSLPADFLPSLVGWMKDNIKERNVVVLNPNDESGADQTQFISKLYKQNGFEVLGGELYERSQKDFQPLLTKVVNMKANVIDLATTAPATAGLIVRQARELGYKGVFVKSGVGGPREIVNGAGKEAAEGTINMVYADQSNDGFKRLAAQYKRNVGQEPNEIIVPFYDATNVLLQAIQKSGDATNTDKVSSAFAQALPMNSLQGDRMTLGGKASTGVDRQIMNVNYIGAIKNGETVIVGKIK
jgi:branched-chain amino acid transport system substrate-binding protein